LVPLSSKSRGGPAACITNSWTVNGKVSTMRFLSGLLTCAAILLWGGQLQAAPISVASVSASTVDGQLHEFTFSPLAPSDGTGGQLLITLDGDYSPRMYPPLSEGAMVTLEGLPGMLDLYNGGGNGVGLNSIAGLSLNSAAGIGSLGNNVTLSWVFDLSSGLLDTLLADNQIAGSVQDAPDVTSSTFGGFVQVGVDYVGNPAPEPTSLALFGMTALGMTAGFRRRRSGDTTSEPA